MWVNLVIAIFNMIYDVYSMSFLGQLYSQAKAVGRMWLTPNLAVQIATTLGLRLFYLYASAGCLRRRPPARIAMLIYCWCSLGLTTFSLLQYLYHFFRVYMDWNYLIRNASSYPQAVAVPVLTLMFITRPPIKSLFGHLPGMPQEDHEETGT
jgi:hypothetical protein